MKRSIRCTSFSLSFAAALVLCIISPALAGPAIDLGTLGGSMSFGSKLNSRGDVIGSSTTAGEAETHAFLKDSAGMQALTLGGSYSTANDINGSGIVVGGSLVPGDNEFHAFVYMNGAMKLLTLGGSSGTALDVNDAGQVVGYSNLFGDQETHAFLYDTSTDQMTDLGTLGGSQSAATAINEAGQVIGYSYVEGNLNTQAFRFSNGQMIALHLGGSSSFANDINSRGEVVGASQVTGDAEYRAFLFNGTQMIDLGGLGGTFSEATDLNDNGVVIGNSNLPGDGASRAFWFDGQNFLELSLGGSSSFAVGINNSGQVAGESFTAGNAAYRAFRFQNGSYTELGLGGFLSYALDINDRGEVIGSAQTSGSSDMVAYRFSRVGIDTLSLGGAVGTAWDINENGEVTGEASLANGETHAFFAAAVATDSRAPVTAFSVSCEPNSSGWYTSSVTVTLRAEDETGGSGVKQVSYSVDGGHSFTSVEGSEAHFQVSSDGVHQIAFFAEDNAGNREETQRRSVRIDRSTPSVSVFIDRNNLNPPNGKMIPITVSGVISDALSGVTDAHFWVEDEYGEVQPAGSVTVGPDGKFCFRISLEARRDGGDPDGRKYTIFVKAWDVAGNRGVGQAVVVVPH